VDNPNQDYNGVRPLSLEARRLDGALPWLSWIGGNAALDLLLKLDPDLVQSHVLGLAGVVRAALDEIGVATEEVDQPSHIVRLYSSRSQEILRQLRSDGVIASGNDQGLRIGIHGFNTLTDVERFLASVDRVIRR
jgi:selenocysteine lyase/cysteine desulfurase